MPAQPPSTTEINTTFRHPPYAYLHLSLLTLPPLSSSSNSQQKLPPPPLDAITALQYLQAALTQSLGLTGAAIPIDILKISNQDVWIRVPYADGSHAVAAVSQWSSTSSVTGGNSAGSAAKGVSWRVIGRAAWLGGLAVGKEGKGQGRLWTLES